MNKKILGFFLLLTTIFFIAGCETINTTDLNLIDDNTVTTSYQSDSITNTYYSLTTQDLSDYLANLEVADPVLTSALAMPSTIELIVDISYSYTATYRTPRDTYTETVTNTITSQATGFFINADGYIVTNAHVISLADYEAYPDFTYTNITVNYNFADSGDRFTASIIAYDIDLDLAILKSDTVFDDQTYLTFFETLENENSTLYYGEPVIAIGNANGYGLSVTTGVISAPLRFFADSYTVVEAIQTDAAINEGNSGGPLLNYYGAVVGINSFKVVTSTSESLGYAIPSNVVMEYLDTNAISYTVTTERSY